MTVSVPQDAAELLSELTSSGRMLCFCDETDLTIEPTSTMVADIHAWVGFLIPSEAYAKAAAIIEQYRASHNLPEFHGTEIVNPKSKSPWKSVPVERRIAAFDFVCAQVDHYAAHICYAYMSKAQYDEGAAEHHGQVPECHKAGVKDYFKATMVERLAAFAPAVLIFDKDKNNPGPTLEPVSTAPHLVGQGILRADSKDIAGLQMADIAAFAVGRYIRRRDKIIAGSNDPIEASAMTLVGNLGSRLTSLIHQEAI